MMRKTIIAIMASVVLMAVPHASAQKFSVKPHAEIDLNSGFGYDSGIEMSAKTASNEFGLDFGYTFLNKGGNRLEVNAGLGYRYLNTTLNAGDFGYDYSAPASADLDGNAYTRFCEVSELSQKINVGYVTLPIYLQYAYRCTPWMEAHALAGVKLGFGTGSSAKTVSGEVYSYGVFPEYDDLMIDAPYLDDFGTVGLTGRPIGETSANSLAAWLMIGAGVDFRIYGPLWVDLGVRYNVGFTDVFAKGPAVSSGKGFTAQTAPVTYTVADGTTLRSLSDYVTSGKFSPLSLNIGVTIRF